MEVKLLMKEIQQLPLKKRFWVMEQTLKSIKNEEINHNPEVDFAEEKELSLAMISASEKSLAKDWLSKEDNRWDNIL